ncbi:hypothetical protein GGR57DRAFT_148552 [Xylariaceae sp. FL1272]|nr:hypothetical protein GGR57DRAFT_148552 [Xylariaceae sp. FL1272]
MALFRSPGLRCLPYELVAYIVRDLDIEDVFNWSLCCKHFQYIVREDRFCKPVIIAKAPSTLEAEEARATGHFARALRRLAKRRYALSHASPYFLGVLGLADSYEFIDGKLCYILESRPKRWLRILDVNRSTKWELVVDVSTLVSIAVPRAANSRKYKFRVLYQAADIVSCLFSFATEHYLIIFNPKEHKLLQTHRLDSAHRIFVRNNDRFLYVGTHSGEGADGFRKWILKGLDLVSLEWLQRPRMFLNDMSGYDIGSSICFEIFDGYFYGLSNQSLFEIDDPDWTSHYYCFRFPLDEPSRETTQVMHKEDSWRRHHVEGPIDDRWGFLKFERDEATDSISIVECRREWLKGRTGSQRTYYTTKVHFRQEHAPATDQQPAPNITMGGFNDPAPFDDVVPTRSPHQVHEGDNSSVPSMLVRSKTHHCSYFRSCQAFIDLLDDTSLNNNYDRQCIRLRAGCRRLKPGASIVSNSCTSDLLRKPTKTDTQEPYHANEVSMWPPEQITSKLEPSLAKISDLLHPKGNQGCIEATGDERSIIYSTSNGSKDGVKVLIILSFDPAVKFQGMEFGGNILGQRVEPCSQQDFLQQPTHRVPMGAENESGFSPEGPIDPTMSTGVATAQSADQLLPPIIPPPQDTKSWAYVARAMHHEMGQKLFFSL